MESYESPETKTSECPNENGENNVQYNIEIGREHHVLESRPKLKISSLQLKEDMDMGWTHHAPN